VATHCCVKLVSTLCDLGVCCTLGRHSSSTAAAHVVSRTEYVVRAREVSSWVTTSSLYSLRQGPSRRLNKGQVR